MDRNPWLQTRPPPSLLHGTPHTAATGMGPFPLHPTTADGNVVDNSPEFIGAATHALLYQNLKLSPGDWNDHYARTPALENGGPEVDRGTMYEFGNYEQNRWHLGKVELAVLEDYGYEVANDQYLNLVEQPEAEAKSRPVKPSERSQKAFSNMINTLKSFLGG